MIVTHHEFERVVVVSVSETSRTLNVRLDARNATLRLMDGCVNVDERRRYGALFDPRFTALAEVVAWTPWWAELKLRCAFGDALVSASLYAVVVADGVVPEHWPDLMRKSLHVT